MKYNPSLLRHISDTELFAEVMCRIQTKGCLYVTPPILINGFTYSGMYALDFRGGILPIEYIPESDRQHYLALQKWPFVTSKN